MAFIVPQPPDELVKLLRAQQGQIPGQAPGTPLGIGAPPGLAAPSMTGGLPAAAAGVGGPAPVQPAKPTTPAPAPSDDPSISQMGEVPKAPDFSSYLQGPLQRMQDTEAKLSSLHNPQPSEYKPKLWRRLLSIPLATAAGLGNPQAGATASDQILNGPLHRAQAEYEAQADPLREDLKHQREGMPLYTAAGEAAWRNFQGQMDTAKEGRERFTAKSNADYKSDLNEIKQNIANDKLDEAQKRLDETAERNKDNAAIQDRLATAREELAAARRDKDEKGKDKSTQFRTVASQKAQAISKANGKYDKAVSDLTPNDVAGHKQAQEEHMRDLQEAQDAYEEGITTLGGTAEHQEVTPSGWKKSGTQPEADQPGKTGEKKEVQSLGKYKKGDVVPLKGQGSVKITKLYADGTFEHEPVK